MYRQKRDPGYTYKLFGFFNVFFHIDLIVVFLIGIHLGPLQVAHILLLSMLLGNKIFTLYDNTYFWFCTKTIFLGIGELSDSFTKLVVFILHFGNGYLEIMRARFPFLYEARILEIILDKLV